MGRREMRGNERRSAKSSPGWLSSMTIRVLMVCAAMTAAVGFAVERQTAAQTSLKIAYGANGVEQISYRGVVLEDTNQNPSDAFHIWHMKLTDLNGKTMTGGQYGWGETNNGRQWDAGSKTWTYPFTWGSIRVQYQQSGDTLNMNVTETNAAGSNVILDGATIYPLALHFPGLPAGFNDASYPQLSYNTTGPSVLAADFGTGMVAAVAPNASKPLYSGFMPSGQANAYTAMISTTTPDGLATFQPHFDRTVMPGQTDSFTVSLRFAASGTSMSTLASDAYASWAKTWPALLQWKDRRILGTAYLASSPTGDASHAGGYPNNPRRYFNDAQASDFDVRSASGLARFQRRVLDQAAATVQNLQRLNAQGVITWDIEGEEYPQETSYVCSPDQIATVAPEMETVVTDRSSRYAGQKLDDAYFKTIHDAGYRVGVCVRPQHFTKNADGTAQQVYLPNDQIGSELIRKMKYAHDRWGATIFYLDSTVETNGAVLDASIFMKAAAALPDSLLIPEETTPKFYAYAAPFKTFLFHGDLGTDAGVRNYYPNAFSVNLINDVDPGKLAAARGTLTDAVRRGDVLMVHADYWQDNNPTVVQMYAEAGRGSSTAGGDAPMPGAPVETVPPDSGTTAPVGVVTAPAEPAPVVGTPDPVATMPSAPVTSTPPTASSPVAQPIAPVTASSFNGVAISSPAADALLSGTVTVAGQLSVSLDAAGSYLMVDGTEIGTRRVVEGPYVYPLDTTMLTNGAHTLQLWAHNTGNDTVLSPTVRVMIANPASGASVGTATSTIPAVSSPPAVATPPTSSGVSQPVVSASPVVLTYPLGGQALSGVVQVAANISHALDAAGSYLLVDGVEAGWRHVSSAPYLYELDTTALGTGAHTLQVWAHDIGNDTLLSDVVTVLVSR